MHGVSWNHRTEQLQGCLKCSILISLSCWIVWLLQGHENILRNITTHRILEHSPKEIFQYQKDRGLQTLILLLTTMKFLNNLVCCSCVSIHRPYLSYRQSLKNIWVSMIAGRLREVLHSQVVSRVSEDLWQQIWWNVWKVLYMRSVWLWCESRIISIRQ